MLGQRGGIVRVPLQPEREGLDALEEEEAVEGALGHAPITEALYACADGKGEVGLEGPLGAKDGPKVEAMVPWGGLREDLEAAIAPVELAGIHHNATNGRAVPADPLGSAGNDDIGAKIDGANQPAPAPKRVVHDDGHTVLVRDSHDALKVGYRGAGVGDGLEVNSAGALIDQLLKVGGGLGGDKLDGDAQARELHLELVVGATIELARRHDVVASLGDGGDGQELSTLARAAEQRGGEERRRDGRGLGTRMCMDIEAIERNTQS